MKKLIFLIIFAIACSSQLESERMSRIRVVSVIDGDTFWAQYEDGYYGKIRMAYIDAPEISQRFGLASMYVLDSLIEGKEVMFYFLEKDKYQRYVGIVYTTAERKNINLFMVERGMAWAYQKYSPTLLYKAMMEARSKKKGLWQNPYPTPPYIYRKQNKN